MTKNLKKIIALCLISTMLIFMNVTIAEAVSPISEVIYEGLDPKEAVKKLMTKSKKAE